MFKTYLQYKNNVQVIYNAKMTYKHLNYVHDLAFGRQSCLQRVRKLSVKVWHIPDSYNFVCGYNVPLEYLLCLMDSEKFRIPKDFGIHQSDQSDQFLKQKS